MSKPGVSSKRGLWQSHATEPNSALYLAYVVYCYDKMKEMQIHFSMRK